jgi:hypothetical protein
MMRPTPTRCAARVLCLIAVLMLSACQPRTTPPDSSESIACGGRFEAIVRQGPSAGLALVGQLVVQAEPSGRAKAVLTLRDGTTVPATGHVNGQAINLVFVVRQDTYLFGVGTSQRDFYECAGVWGGPFVGPELGDMGDWLGTQIKPASH